jgi:hypothetical protein
MFTIAPIRGETEITIAKADLHGLMDHAVEKGYRVASAQEVIQKRIASGEYSGVCQTFGHVSETFILVPGKGIFISRDSPILRNYAEAYQCAWRDEFDYPLNSAQVRKALRDSVKVVNDPRVRKKVREFKKTIPAERFGKDKITRFLFGEDAEEYAKISPAGLTINMLSPLGDKPYARQASLTSVSVGTDMQGWHHLSRGESEYFVIRAPVKEKAPYFPMRS